LYQSNIATFLFSVRNIQRFFLKKLFFSEKSFIFAPLLKKVQKTFL